jgi:hypothetical protein
MHAFEVLGEDRFHSVVLTPLLQCETAANLALTCKQLRHLCNSAARDLHFTPENCVPAPTQIPERFPNCSKVRIDLWFAVDLPVTYPPLLTLLSRYELLSIRELLFG